MASDTPNQSERAILNGLTSGPRIFVGERQQAAAASCVSKGWAQRTAIRNQFEITDDGRKTLKG